MSNDVTFTELDSQLQKMAAENWAKFVKIIGQRNINKAKVCLLKKQNRSLNYMALRTKMNRTTVSRACKICPDLDTETSK